MVKLRQGNLVHRLHLLFKEKLLIHKISHFNTFFEYAFGHKYY